MTGIVIQAHMGSTRFPGKVMKMLGGKPMLRHVVERSEHAKKTDIVIVATSTKRSDDVVEQFCEAYGYACFRGPDEDVTARYCGAAQRFALDAVVRVTSDCPLIDPDIIDRVIEARERGGYDYAANYLNDEYLNSASQRLPAFPHGLEVETYSRGALERAHHEATEPFDREHVTWVWKNTDGSFRLAPTVTAPPSYQRTYRLTIDYPEDFALMEKLYALFYREGEIIDVVRVLAYLDQHPEIASINAHRAQK